MKTLPKGKKIVLIITELVLIILFSVLFLSWLGNRNEEQNSDITYYTHNDIASKKDSIVEGGQITLYYDDRYEFDEAVKKVRTQRIESYKTGTSAKDESVLDVKGNRVIARGVGKAEVELTNGDSITVTVRKAPISLILIAGQSNGEGRIAENHKINEVKNQYVLNEEGSCYNTYGVSDSNIAREVIWSQTPTESLSIDNYSLYLPNSLWDNNQNSKISKTNNITDAAGASGKGGIESAFAWRWNAITGEKIWIVNAAHHGASITKWQKHQNQDNNNYNQAVLLYKGAERILSDEIKAGHYRLKHKGIIWYQGEADCFDISAREYIRLFKTMRNDLYSDLDGSGIKGLEKKPEFIAVMMPRAFLFKRNTRNDLKLTGPRTALYYLTRAEDMSDVILASHIEELWLEDENVSDYFINQYGTDTTFQEAYPTKEVDRILPKTEGDVHGDYHFSQLAYNEMGFDAAENISIFLGYSDVDSKVGKVSVVFQDGETDYSGKTVEIPKGKLIPFAVKVYPASETKNIRITSTDGIRVTSDGIILKNGDSGTITIRVNDYQTNVAVKAKQ